jgi:hypothetical protein
MIIQGGIGHDHAVKGITSPGEFQSAAYNRIEALIAYFETDPI